MLLSCLVVFSGLTLQKLQEASIVHDFLEVDPCDVHIYSSITNMSRQDRTRQDRTGQDRTGQDRTRQDKTWQDKPTPEKKRRDKTRQDKTRTTHHKDQQPKKNTRKRFTAAPRLINQGAKTNNNQDQPRIIKQG